MSDQAPGGNIRARQGGAARLAAYEAAVIAYLEAHAGGPSFFSVIMENLPPPKGVFLLPLLRDRRNVFEVHDGGARLSVSLCPAPQRWGAALRACLSEHGGAMALTQLGSEVPRPPSLAPGVKLLGFLRDRPRSFVITREVIPGGHDQFTVTLAEAEAMDEPASSGEQAEAPAANSKFGDVDRVAAAFELRLAAILFRAGDAKVPVEALKKHIAREQPACIPELVPFLQRRGHLFRVGLVGGAACIVGVSLTHDLRWELELAIYLRLLGLTRLAQLESAVPFPGGPYSSGIDLLDFLLHPSRAHAFRVAGAAGRSRGEFEVRALDNLSGPAPAGAPARSPALERLISRIVRASLAPGTRGRRRSRHPWNRIPLALPTWSGRARAPPASRRPSRWARSSRRGRTPSGSRGASSAWPAGSPLGRPRRTARPQRRNGTRPPATSASSPGTLSQR